MGALRLVDVDVAVRGATVLSGIDVSAETGDFVAVVGPSGSGKTTVLRAVAGLAPIARGRIEFDGVDVTRSSPQQRDVGMVFQTPALLPRRDGSGNVALPLELRGLGSDAIRERVGLEAMSLRIEHLMARAPNQMSRGEQQMVQIARTMIRTPHLLLVDEPFAALDPDRRQRMRTEIGLLQRATGVTAMMATNDPDDVAALADRLVVLGHPPGVDAGPTTVVQVGTPTEVADEPATSTVALVTGPIWIVEATVVAEGSGAWLHATPTSTSDDDDRHRLRLRSWSPTVAARRGRSVLVGIRPTDLRVAAGPGDPGPAGAAPLGATFDRAVPIGPSPALCRWGATTILVGHRAPSGLRRGDTVGLAIDRFYVFDPDTGERLV